MTGWNQPDRPERAWLLVGLGLVVFGAVLRIWVLTEPLGSVDSDEAVVGLMARRILSGEFPVFYWGQAYGGTVEAFMTAPLFAVAGTSFVTLKLIPLLLYAVAGFFVWAIGCEVFGRRVGLIAAALFWVAPAAFVYRSTQAYSFYVSSLIIGLAALLLILRLSKSIEDRYIWLLGLVLGLGWWTNQQIIPLVIPALVWIFLRNRDFRLRVPKLVPGFIVGASPWIVNNLVNDWHSLRLPWGAFAEFGYLDRLGGFFRGAVPMLLGLRIPISNELVVAEVIAALIALVVWGLCIWTAYKSGGAAQILGVVVAIYPFIYAVSPYTWHFADARYVFLLWPVIAILAIAGAFRLSPHVAAAVLLTVTTVAFTQVVIANRQEAAHIGTMNLYPPTDLTRAADRLHELGINEVFADYWVAYKLTFESDERIIAASLSPGRYPPYQQWVRAAKLPAYVFVKGTHQITTLKHVLGKLGIGFDEYEADGLIAIMPKEKVLPEKLGELNRRIADG